MRRTEWVKRFALLLPGSFFMGLGVALTKCAELGLSTISSVPNILSLRFSFFSLGTFAAIWNYVMLLAQVLILKKDFKPIQLLQIPVSMLFGYCTDFGVFLFSALPLGAYLWKLIACLLGIALLGFGISLTVISGTVMNPGEALVKVIADKTGKDFGTVKIAFDFFCVVLAAMLSLLFFPFRILGIREGTVLAVFGTGLCVKIFTKICEKPLTCWFRKR